MLYDVFLHELGHLQLVRPQAKEARRRFAMETLAQEFCDYWHGVLWSQQFDHPDPIHNPPERSNHPVPGNAGIASRLTEHHCSGVPEPERSIAKRPRWGLTNVRLSSMLWA
jgi:hypothetical protein